MKDAILNFLGETGVAYLFAEDGWWRYLIMYVIIGALLYLAIVKKFEPLLLMPIAFGMLLANLPGAGLIHLDFFFDDYYINFVDLDLSTITAELKPSVDAFLAAVKDAFGESAYAIEDNIVKFSEDIKFEALKPIFDTYLNGSAFLSSDMKLVVVDSTAALAPQFADFLKALAQEYGSNVYSIKDYVMTFDWKVIAPEYINDPKGIEYAYDELKPIFNEYMGSFAKLTENLGVQIKMSAMIKEVINYGGLIDILYLGVKLGIYPSLIFLGVGAMTDFTPLIANPKSLLMGAGAQLGVFVAFFVALFLGFTPMEACAIGIIGGADGPTAILVTKELAPHLLGAIAIAAYSYMALIPIIQPPFMRLLTTPEERKIKMGNLRPVSQTEKVLFPIIVTFLVVLVIRDAAPLVGFLMLGNLFNVSGVTDRLSKTAQNELCNIVTICLGVSVGATANAENFLKPQTIFIIVLGLCAFIVSTCGGLITGKIMCKLTGGKINPLIGSAGVSAVPMAARVAQDEGRKADPSNFLLMHAMGPNVAGVIGSAVAAGVFLSFFR